MGAYLSISAVITFFNSKLGRYCLGGLILASAYLAGDIRGRRVEHDKCVAAAEAARVAAANMDKQAKAQTEADTQSTIADLKSQKEKADAQLAALQDQLATRPLGAPCLYGPNGQPAGGVRNNGHRPGPKRPAGPTVLPSAPTGH